MIWNCAHAIGNRPDMRPIMYFVAVALIAVGGCMSAVERAERDRAAVARRITEICSLPPAERDAALERLKEESGLVLVCGGN